MSLQGKRVVITRAINQVDSLIKCLQEKGAIPLLYPCIAIVPRELKLNLSAYDWLLVTSSNTAYALKGHDVSQVKIAAIGKATAEAVETYLGRAASFISERQTGKALAQSLPLEQGKTVLLPHSALANDEISQILTERGAIIHTVTAYDTLIGQGGEDIPAMLKLGNIDALSFTSSSAIDNFIKRIQPQSALDLPAAVIGPSSASTAQAVGFSKIIMPKLFTIDAMIEALDAYFG
jgi:uroporphyrinogen-III synthase